MKTVKIFNTNEIRENKFYFLETPGKIQTQNSMFKTEKIDALIRLHNARQHPFIPSFIKRATPHPVIDSEIELEFIRQKEYPTYPSRCACFFAFDNINDVLKYKNQEPTGKEIFELKLTSSNYKITKHNMEYITVIRVCHGNPSIAVKENLFHRYWSGEASNFDYTQHNSSNGIITPTFEYLIEGEFEYKLINLD